MAAGFGEASLDTFGVRDCVQPTRGLVETLHQYFALRIPRCCPRSVRRRTSCAISDLTPPAILAGFHVSYVVARPAAGRVRRGKR